MACHKCHLQEVEVRIISPYHNRDTVPVDACIAEEIQWLNDQGIITLGCCCGHGQGLYEPHTLIAEESIEDAIRLGYKPTHYRWGRYKILLKGDIE